MVVEDLAFVAEALLLTDTSAGFALGRTAGAPEAVGGGGRPPVQISTRE